MRNLAVSLLTVPLIAQGTPTQMKPFRVSPAVALSHDLGISTLKLEYARPAVKGRKIWGEVVPYGQIWRAGANAATAVTFSDAVRVAGKDVPAGSYALFAIPGPEQWTWVLNKQAKQWGAYFHKEADDVVRWTARPRAIPHQEWLTYEVQPDGERAWKVELRWEKVAVPFEIEVEVRGIYWKHLEDTLARAKDTEWTPWYQAADYCFKQDIHPDKALAWIEKSLKAGESFWNHECMGRILQRAGRTAEALPHLEKALELAKGKAPKEWSANVQRDIDAWKSGQKR
jgi:tetratricopeptide (TPR) repeat protein